MSILTIWEQVSWQTAHYTYSSTVASKTSGQSGTAAKSSIFRKTSIQLPENVAL